MSKILKNQTASPVSIPDFGRTVSASGQLVINPNEYSLLASSSDVITLVSDKSVSPDPNPISTLIVNDGSDDLSISDGVDLIKGLFPKKIAAGNITLDQFLTFRDDRAKVDVEFDEHGGILDGFGKLRVSNSDIVWSFMPTSGKHDDDLWNEILDGAATSTYVAEKNSIRLSTTTASGDRVRRATNRYFIYTPNRSQFIAMSGNFEGAQVNVRKRLGQFDELDGFFFELNGTDFGVVIRSSTSGSAVDDFVSQSNWSLDKLDGTGFSGSTLDLTKQQIMVMDYQYLGSGRVRFGFFFGGMVVYCHEFVHANVFSIVYARTPNLPFRAEIENLDAIDSPSNLNISCFSLTVEGGILEFGKTSTFTSGTIGKTIGSVETYLFSIRLNPLTNRLALKPLQFQFIMTSGTKSVLIRGYFNATLTAPNWQNFGDISQSDIEATAFSGGKKSQELYLNIGGATSIDAETDLRSETTLSRDLNGVSDTLTVTAQTLGGAAKLLYSSTVKEFV